MVGSKVTTCKVPSLKKSWFCLGGYQRGSTTNRVLCIVPDKIIQFILSKLPWTGTTKRRSSIRRMFDKKMCSHLTPCAVCPLPGLVTPWPRLAPLLAPLPLSPLPPALAAQLPTPCSVPPASRPLPHSGIRRPIQCNNLCVFLSLWFHVRNPPKKKFRSVII